MAVLSVIIPAYNEENGIASIVQRVQSTREGLHSVDVNDLEVVVVDDGSKDHTGEIVAALPNVVLISHVINHGYGAALKTGFSHARGDLLGFLDADGTYPPEHFPDLCREALNGADLVVGSRRSGAESHMPLMRRVGNLLWSKMVSLFCKTTR